MGIIGARVSASTSGGEEVSGQVLAADLASPAEAGGPGIFWLLLHVEGQLVTVAAPNVTAVHTIPH
jgi:hypothetical protein